ncbi:hypothetical protein AHAT_21180 [Agarivorans sp. Toyoura001]|uniref:hypothetical protein n=1 Tax=Agarivorans sp. Toyoura001 TaxID=2283141 RepID=UPI0010EA4C66|nr:hypothetical protein [Agarivorans sp. Toyoura001]GDY26228.1 hypothetical protein AHAT_21180 [Agarivorans sp. Toyoura001]
MNKFAVLGSSALVTLALSACGGSSSDNGNELPPTTDPVNGTFIDAAVEGLFYKASPSGLSGYTNAEGTFEVEPGDVVSFYLGGENGMFIGNSSYRSVVSPFEVTADTGSAMNLARILQSLDDASTGSIVIPDDIAKPAADSNTLIALKQVKLNNLNSADALLEEVEASEWVSEEEAAEHLNESLDGIERGDSDVIDAFSKGSGEYLRLSEVVMNGQYGNNSTLYQNVHMDRTIPDEAFKNASFGISSEVLHLASNALVIKAGTSDQRYSSQWAKEFIACELNGGEFTVNNNTPECFNADSNTYSAEDFAIEPGFQLVVKDPSQINTEDEAIDYAEVASFGGLFACMNEQNCSQANLTALGQSEFEDDGELKQQTYSTSYDNATGIYTDQTIEVTLDGAGNQLRKSASTSYSYLVNPNVDNGERYIDFSGTWLAETNIAGCSLTGQLSYQFGASDIRVVGKELHTQQGGDCILEDMDETVSYADLANMAFWWFGVNAGQTSKATLAQLNSSVRWCDDDEVIEGQLCQSPKIEQWSYVAAGKNWDQGVLTSTAFVQGGQPSFITTYTKSL